MNRFIKDTVAHTRLIIKSSLTPHIQGGVAAGHQCQRIARLHMGIAVADIAAVGIAARGAGADRDANAGVGAEADPDADGGLSRLLAPMLEC